MERFLRRFSSFCLLFSLFFAVVFTCCRPVYARLSYKVPSKDIVDIIDAPLPERFMVSPTGDKVLLVSRNVNPPIEVIARPFLRLGGLRINPETNGLRDITVVYTGISVLDLVSGKKIPMVVPKNSEISGIKFSHDGKKIAFMRDVKTGLQLWIGDIKTGKVRPIKNLLVNSTTGTHYSWAPDNRRLLVNAVPAERGKAPVRSLVPESPRVEETSGKKSQMPTYQDLSQNSSDDALFKYYCTGVLVFVYTETGDFRRVGEAGVFTEARISPDGRYIYVERLLEPYSHRVPYYYYPCSGDVWDSEGNVIKNLYRCGAYEEVPRWGVITGPRYVSWQPFMDATLVWVEALDGGDTFRDVPNHDRLMKWDAPFSGESVELARLKLRYGGIYWLSEKNRCIVVQNDRKRYWTTRDLYDFSKLGSPPRNILSISVNDAYGDPGSPVMNITFRGESVVRQRGDSIYLAGYGSSPRGDLPFLDSYDLLTGKTRRLFHCREGFYEDFIAFAGSGDDSIITCRESMGEIYNFYIINLKEGKRRQVTHFNDPAPFMKGVKKELIKYRREDGVELSGILLLPPGYKKGTRLPLIMWAYPREYGSGDTAGQVRGSTNKYNFLLRSSPNFFLLKGYALFEAPMPVVGKPEEVNDTFIKQIVSNAKATIDKLDEMGVIDRRRVLVGGHSYGAFMTANLLAHSDLFAAGIARSGAYNRTLTPFGFQHERRTFWEAPEFYLHISPITYINKIKSPLLIIHGEDDSNPGTYPMQSTRLFEGIRGNGGTARLVMLPLEDHAYYARESNLHVLAEMLEWAEKYLKDAPKTR